MKTTRHKLEGHKLPPRCCIVKSWQTITPQGDSGEQICTGERRWFEALGSADELRHHPVFHRVHCCIYSQHAVHRSPRCMNASVWVGWEEPKLDFPRSQRHRGRWGPKSCACDHVASRRLEPDAGVCDALQARLCVPGCTRLRPSALISARLVKPYLGPRKSDDWTSKKCTAVTRLRV